MVKYTKTYETLPRGLGKMLNKLEPSITKSIPQYAGNRPRYIIAYSGSGVPRGILVWCYRCARRFGKHNMPFLAEMDTAIHHRGYGDLLFRQFLSEVSYRFFLLCMDDNAERFWRYIGAKHNLIITSPFKSPWGTPALLMKRNKDEA